MSYEEYLDKVVDSLARDLIGEDGIKTKEDVRRYIKSEEDVVKDDYSLHIKEYNAGKFPKGVWEGCINSTAYCLYMLY